MMEDNTLCYMGSNNCRGRDTTISICFSSTRAIIRSKLMTCCTSKNGCVFVGDNPLRGQFDHIGKQYNPINVAQIRAREII